MKNAISHDDRPAMTQAQQDLGRIAGELHMLLMMHAPQDFNGGTADPNMMMIQAAGYRMLADNIEQDARTIRAEGGLRA